MASSSVGFIPQNKPFERADVSFADNLIIWGERGIEKRGWRPEGRGVSGFKGGKGFGNRTTASIIHQKSKKSLRQCRTSRFLVSKRRRSDESQ